MTTHRSTFRNTDRELHAALDEIGGSSHKAPKRIPVGITTPKQKRAHRCFRLEAVQARKPLGELDASVARGVKAQLEMQLYAESAYAAANPEDEIIDRLDRERGEQSLGKLLCLFAGRSTRRAVHRG